MCTFIENDLFMIVVDSRIFSRWY